MASPKQLTRSQRLRAAGLCVGLGLLGDRQSATTCFKAAFTGAWEGYEENRFRNRPGRRTTAEDTDLNYGVRELMISEARALEQTFPLAGHIATKYADYCVGKCKVKWDTGDPAIDKSYRDNWENFMDRCDVNGIHDFPKLSKLAVSSTVRDGDIFSQKVNVQNYLQLRLIEADRVSSNGIFNADLFGGDGPTMIGGIGLDPNGRPAFIRVWDRTIYGTFINSCEIPKKDWLHLFNSKRHDSYRGVTSYHAILNPLRDIKEAGAAELTAIKMNGKLAILHKLITGPVQQGVDLIGDGIKADGPNGVTTQRLDDGTIAYMFPGEDAKAHEYNRPGGEWIPFMEYNIRQIANGVNLPFGVVWHMAGMGKPAILADLQAAKRTFDSFIDQFEKKWFRPIVAVETALAIQAGRCPSHPNWTKFKTGRPAPITIDAGRDSTAGLNENRMGMRSAKNWFFETEDDWEEETEQCFIEQKFREAMAEKYKVDINTVRLLTPNGNPGNPADPVQLEDDEPPTGPAKPAAQPAPKKQLAAA